MTSKETNGRHSDGSGAGDRRDVDRANAKPTSGKCGKSAGVNLDAGRVAVDDYVFYVFCVSRSCLRHRLRAAEVAQSFTKNFKLMDQRANDEGPRVPVETKAASGAVRIVSRKYSAKFDNRRRIPPVGARLSNGNVQNWSNRPITFRGQPVAANSEKAQPTIVATRAIGLGAEPDWLSSSWKCRLEGQPGPAPAPSTPRRRQPPWPSPPPRAPWA